MNKNFANKLQNTINKLSAIADQLEAGQGTAGRILKDESLYNNTNEMLVETRGNLGLPKTPKKKS